MKKPVKDEGLIDFAGKGASTMMSKNARVSMHKNGLFIRAISLLAVAFGLLTIKEGGAILFGREAAQASAGNYVPFVLWFNFLAGFAYVIAGVGLWLRYRSAVWLAIVIAAATATAFAAFGAHIYAGGAYEMRTVIAMSFRTLVWVAIAAISWRCLSRGKPAMTARNEWRP